MRSAASTRAAGSPAARRRCAVRSSDDAKRHGATRDGDSPMPGLAQRSCCGTPRTRRPWCSNCRTPAPCGRRRGGNSASRHTGSVAELTNRPQRHVRCKTGTREERGPRRLAGGRSTGCDRDGLGVGSAFRHVPDVAAVAAAEVVHHRRLARGGQPASACGAAPGAERARGPHRRTLRPGRLAPMSHSAQGAS